MPLADGISFTAASSGTGTFVFGVARPSFLTLSQAMVNGELADGQIVSYLAQDSLSNPVQREWGHGIFSAIGAGSIARTSVFKTVNNGVAGVGTPLNFTNPPVVSLTLLAEDVPQLAVSNLTFYVATTGSDSNPGTIGSPFRTVQHAINVLNQFDYQNLYTGTVLVADGTYNEDITVLNFERCLAAGIFGHTGNPALVTIGTAGGDFALTHNATFITSVDGITWRAPTACISINEGSVQDFFGTLGFNVTTNTGIVISTRPNAFASFFFFGCTITLTAPSGIGIFASLVGPAGVVVLDTSTIVLPASLVVGSSFYLVAALAQDVAGYETFSVRGITYVNGGSTTGPRVSINTYSQIQIDNGDLTLIPGNSLFGAVDSTCSLQNSSTGKIGILGIPKSGLPANTDLPPGSYGIFKDSSGGGVYVAYNDAGTIKKVALT